VEFVPNLLVLFQRQVSDEPRWPPSTRPL
jgi:hypothetical protein